MLRLLLIIGLINISSCSQQKTKKSPEEKVEKPFSEMTPKEKVDDVNKDMIDTDKNQALQEWQNNLYRNNKYKFRIEFPKKWEYAPGASKNTLAQALNRRKAAVIGVAVTERQSGFTEIQDSELKDYGKKLNEILALQNQEAKNLKIQKGTLNNFPAHIMQYSTILSSGTMSDEYFVKQIQCIYDSKQYIITIRVVLDEWNKEMSNIFDRVVHSFVFEIV